MPMVIIKRCRLYNRIPMHKLLVAISQLFSVTTLQQYHEKDFTITNRVTSESIELLSAPFLVHLAIHPNPHLQQLYIVNSAVRSIPKTIANLANLQFLGIDQAHIRMVDLGLVCALPELRMLQLVKNQISMLLPAPDPSCYNTLRELFLNNNQLTTLDLALLAPFVALERLFFERNRMHSIVCTNATSFPFLHLLALGPGNNLTWISLDQLHLPTAFTIDLQDNQFDRLPYLNHNGIRELKSIYLNDNKLSTVDLAHFAPHQHLDSIHLARNKLHSVSCGQRVHLPTLTTLYVAHNLLESISLANCSFPNLKSISLMDNRFQRVPGEICFSAVSPAASPTVGTLCDAGAVCRISELDMTDTPEGLAVLAKEPSSTYISITIERLTIGATTIAALLVNASTITNSVQFKKFHEKNIFLPSTLTLEELSLQEARNLRTIVVPTNRHLKQLEIANCPITIVPPALRNLVSLRGLRLKMCAVKTFNLALLANLQHLETVQFTDNNITSIYPPQTAIVANIRIVDLSYNQLRRLDMSVLRSLQLMKTLTLDHNQLSTIGYRPGETVTLHSLSTLRLLNNKLERISFAQLNATRLEFLVLSSNMLNTVPQHLDSFPNLKLLTLSNNQLASFDFTSLQSLAHLQSLDLFNNRLRSVDLPGEMVLPNLNHLALANNELESIALQQLTAPRLSSIDLGNNLLVTIPNVFEKEGMLQLQSLNVVDNPLTCATYDTYRKHIQRGVIVASWLGDNLELCFTGKYFTLSATQRACCRA
uniref:Uncharacterized protein n=1 Tax=Anopheles stephensi TaxID=30069 RepID=A0A182XYT9_ANOST